MAPGAGHGSGGADGRPPPDGLDPVGGMTTGRWMIRTELMTTSSWIGPAGRHLVRALDALPTGGRGTFGARHGCLPVVCRAGAAAGDLADHHDATSRVMAQFGS